MSRGSDMSEVHRLPTGAIIAKDADLSSVAREMLKNYLRNLRDLCGTAARRSPLSVRDVSSILLVVDPYIEDLPHALTAARVFPGLHTREALETALDRWRKADSGPALEREQANNFCAALDAALDRAMQKL